MDYRNILVSNIYGGIKIVINRPQQKNSLSMDLVKELRGAIEATLDDKDVKVIIITGINDKFCTGMDFNQCVSGEHGSDFTVYYMELLKLISTVSKVVVSEVNGEVMAGGMGLVAASDLAVAVPEARFSLSEAIWGIIPAMVAPYLIRKSGFSQAYRMSLTALPITADQALQNGIVDAVGSNTERETRTLLSRIYRMDCSTIERIKSYYRKIWIIDDDMEKLAARESADVILSDKVQKNIYNFINYKKFPWDE